MNGQRPQDKIIEAVIHDFGLATLAVIVLGVIAVGFKIWWRKKLKREREHKQYAARIAREMKPPRKRR